MRRCLIFMNVIVSLHAATPTHLEPKEFQVRLGESTESQLIDLRKLGETAGETLPEAQLITFDRDSFTSKAAALNKQRPVFLYASTTEPANEAAALLQESGFASITVLKGGMAAWKQSGLRTERKLSEFWDRMYGIEGYLYGREPNVFLKQTLEKLKPGRLLLPAEGEGRNAVYGAAHGWQVDAFDITPVGQKKALRLASELGVKIEYKLADFGSPGLDSEAYDAVALIYTHVPPEVRRPGHLAICKSLKKGGIVIVEAFCPAHLELKSGFGPTTADILYTTEMLKQDFSALSIELLEEKKITLNEGRHLGEGVVVRMLARKPL
jgi:rhodanese-related sulfurtransferase